jgi:hypothetical protein
MKKTAIALITTIAAMTVGQAWAATKTDSRSEMKVSEVNEQAFSKKFVINPKIGFLNYKDTLQRDNTDFLIGAAADWNLAADTDITSPIHYGVASGIFYSPLSSSNDQSAFIIPADAFLGYRFANDWAITAHAGLNLFLQGETAGIDLDNNTDNIEFVTNTGLTVGYQILKDFAATARVDWTFATNSTPFTGTLGVAFPLT